ncbi:hypothetical protein DM02DRAFT_686755 [Periconia macrospinosa]|uniref:Uncharacterized protein n=1 Tax=Periconia macrospinosa TaxID=97972 RepID=A0A2V1DI07_9PLEO|nr:hypothetical protein DM02DRAFT_686755 [Periconia macrospinosa]
MIKFFSIISVTVIVYLAGWFSRLGFEYQCLKMVQVAQMPPTGTHELRFAVVPDTHKHKDISKISQKKIFWNNHTFNVDKNDKTSQAAWGAYFSSNSFSMTIHLFPLLKLWAGFITLNADAVRHAGLPKSTVVRGRQMYSIAAYHQLHCVHVIRYAWGELKSKGPSVLEEMYPGLESLAEGYTVEGHVSHCLDMIRQALECHADPTLEPMMSDDGVTSGGTLASGWGGTPHLCRDFSALTKWVDAPEQFPIPSVEAFSSAFSGAAHDHHDGHEHHGQHKHEHHEK